MSGTRRGLAAFALLATTGCEAMFSPLGLALTAGSTGGRMAMQERGFGQGIDDNAIALGINRAWLGADPAIFRLVDTSVSAGRVLLTGSVRYPETRVEAARLAWTVNGVREVLNEIQVTDTRGLTDGPADAWISAKVRFALALAPSVNAINYSVDTVNRTVYLMGIAQNQAELDDALAAARETGGVRDVVSHVRLKSEPPPSLASADHRP